MGRKIEFSEIRATKIVEISIFAKNSGKSEKKGRKNSIFKNKFNLFKRLF
jgi:hypothetical protein